ncbi:MAG: hypothetical protein HY649_07175 [Acidobacteria bacterium]|nr:hypothetical protein [Acidobacteriota bacterium]
MLKLKIHVTCVISALFTLAGGQVLRGQTEGPGQGEKSSTASVRIVYSGVGSYAGSVVELPFYVAASVPVASLESELEFPKKVLEFVNASKGSILETEANVTFAAEVLAKDNSESEAVLKLRFEAGGNEEKSLPTGLLAIISFRIAADADTGDLQLKHSAVAKSPGSTQNPIRDVSASSPVVAIYPKGFDPLVPCFFFTH